MLRKTVLMLALAIAPLAACAQRAVSAARSFEPAQETKVDQIISIFENSTPDLQYAYIEALGDGRGYTAGRAGFTTATGDLYLVATQYVALQPAAKDWSALIPRLRQLSASGSGSTTGLESLPSMWKSAANTSTFRQVQDAVTNELYKDPARTVCAQLGLKTPLAYLVIYDSIIQHGNGDDDDSLQALIDRTHSSGEEKDFLRAFLNVRRADLMNPANSETTSEWRESVDRVDALKRLLDQGNWNLVSPLRLEVWGETYAL